MAPPVLQYLLLLLIALCSTVLVHSIVPEDKTFQFINQGEFTYGEWFYAADYRRVDPGPYSYPFSLYFYSTIKDANKLVLGISGGETGRDSIFWVWSANPTDPVGENSTLTFGSDGNLVLADFDGRIAWQTNTANKGVTGMSMQPNGNLVLHDKDGKFVWQSFYYPSDGLLVGQSLMHSRSKKLVNGPYSLVIGKKGFIMYQNRSGTLVRYAGWEASGLRNVKYDSVQQDDATTATYFLTLGFANKQHAENTTSTPSQPPFIDMTTRDGRFPPPSPESEAPAPAPAEMALPQLRPLQRRVILAKVYFGDLTKNTMNVRANINLSFLRLEPDGNLKVHNFYTWPNGFAYWDDSYAFFGDTVEQCALESKCGVSGSCNVGMCSACPPNGSVGCMVNT
ncbi:hypothetical protein C5167_011940 [Papaver somniferum]|uniref:Bulb-type lectin domain-containing protein n=1 Tax=Papaver somniferum TaxID=3469 RepID=A0A4Y7J000_PAPSO|nr:EP1-like glycoprotein 3 [Papaver somniferum]RZC53079.1 hypothetical protein C5167_011940 [Papaver somniferum]